MMRLEGVTKIYPGEIKALDNLTLEVGDGELMAVVGPSGCGKSTALRIVAGLTKISAGRVWIDSRDVTRLSPQDRDIAMVFQSYALYPHMVVRKNLEFGLKMAGVPKAVIRERVTRVSRMLGLEPLLDRRPHELSGGERQRVAMGRAIVREPRAFLLDEPLANLDANLRVQLRAELLEMRNRLRKATLYVTHDQVEAMTLGHRVAILDKGVLQQVGTGREVYDRPANVFVATFIGSPAMNMVPATVGRGAVDICGRELPFRPSSVQAAWRGQDVLVGIRPTAFEADQFCHVPEWPRIEVSVRGIEELGDEKIILADLNGTADWKGLDGVEGVTKTPQDAPITARVHAQTSVQVGGRLRLAVNPDAFYFFDPVSQKTIGFGA
jgi:multiple sugar transport system ATP-binding protein